MPRKKSKKKSNKVTLAQKLTELNDIELEKTIAEDARPCYPSDQPSKPKQIEAVMNLVRLRNTFVMAGTGFGKSRIPEMYLHLFAKTNKPVVIVLNPLDALGDNQVQEKIAQGFTAINLKKMNFDETIAAKILKAQYNFIYLSPEILLNNQMFTDVYHNPKFQEHLVLTVVDESHMIYSWGLVANKKAKKSSAHKRHQDRSIFRPSYGDIGRALMATQNTPILMLSATCRPLAITEILKSLRIPEDNMHFIRAELTRPEIRILRFPMKCSLKSTNDLGSMFGAEGDLANDKLPPTLIYSGTRNATLQVMKVVNQARGIADGHEDPDSTLIHRYHACTGDMDKDDTISGYERAEFPMISCTMALGLGQNWKRVRRVIHMGRGDPSCICQMMGRCGRDGKPGLAILFMEPKRRFGLNTSEAIAKGDKQSDDVRMDSLALTPVCLRIAFSVDNLYVVLYSSKITSGNHIDLRFIFRYGYVPMDRDDANYLREEIRELDEDFPPCKCSNCAPEEAEMLRTNMSMISNDNFESLLDHPDSLYDPQTCQPTSAKRTRCQKKKPCLPNPIIDQFVVTLVDNFNRFFRDTYGKARSFLPAELFSSLEANEIANNLDCITSQRDIDKYIGGEMIDGQLEMLHNCILNFREGTEFKNYKNEREKYDENIQNEIQRIKGIPEANRLAKQQLSTQQKEPKRLEAEEKKRKREVEKTAKEERLSREKEAKAKRWLDASAFIESRKQFYGTESHRASGSGPT
ncbi:ATP-dependent DNA helicase sgs1 [Puccinia graminis f. sp. tritici]|uniref:DNA 3'-5' helicase n=1 Tax=Puccinia graminis f. sp. tritici TaxID=56615 RepID=A0A5B0RGK4_PUCGR|nr:ATP-dependent DNA helicase sgs1 [Puccinia graminis f. sp. tritici]